MILYHGSDVEVKDPKIIKTEKGRDFGCAFYLTPIKEQAERMARRKQRMNKSSSAVVSVFEWNEKEIKRLKYKTFKNPDLEWLNMIIETILFVIDGVIKKEDALERLKFQKINSQVAFCSEESLKLIKFINSYEVE